MVLEKDGENQLDRSCEKLSVRKSQGGEKYATHNKKEEDYLDCSHLA